MLKFDLFKLEFDLETFLENLCGQSLSIMANFAFLVCMQIEIEGFRVCHLLSFRTFSEFEQCVTARC